MTIAVTGTQGCRLAGAQLSTQCIVATRAAAETNISVPVPAKNCRLIHVEAITTTVVVTGNFVIDLELDTAGGSAIGTITALAASSAIGDIATLTWANMTQANAKNLSYDNASRDRINLELNGTADAAAVQLFLFFEADY